MVLSDKRLMLRGKRCWPLHQGDDVDHYTKETLARQEVDFNCYKTLEENMEFLKYIILRWTTKNRVFQSCKVLYIYILITNIQFISLKLNNIHIYKQIISVYSHIKYDLPYISNIDHGNICKWFVFVSVF